MLNDQTVKIELDDDSNTLITNTPDLEQGPLSRLHLEMNENIETITDDYYWSQLVKEEKDGDDFSQWVKIVRLVWDV